jgi:hypothetical protein
MVDDYEIQKIQKELAEISISNGLLQTSTWKRDDHLEIDKGEQLPLLSNEVLPEVGYCVTFLSIRLSCI